MNVFPPSTIVGLDFTPISVITATCHLTSGPKPVTRRRRSTHCTRPTDWRDLGTKKETFTTTSETRDVQRTSEFQEKKNFLHRRPFRLWLDSWGEVTPSGLSWQCRSWTPSRWRLHRRFRRLQSSHQHREEMGGVLERGRGRKERNKRNRKIKGGKERLTR